MPRFSSLSLRNGVRVEEIDTIVDCFYIQAQLERALDNALLDGGNGSSYTELVDTGDALAALFQLSVAPNTFKAETSMRCGSDVTTVHRLSKPDLPPIWWAE